METDKRPRAFVINESYVSLIVWNVSLPKVRLALVLLLLLLTLDLDLNRIVRLRDPFDLFEKKNGRLPCLQQIPKDGTEVAFEKRVKKILNCPTKLKKYALKTI